jgi:hypothetical protein
VNPQISFAEEGEVKSEIQAAVIEQDEAIAIPIQASIAVLKEEFIIFAVPNGPTYLFKRTKTSEQGCKFACYGETESGTSHAAFKRMGNGSLRANVYVSGTTESSELEARYFAKANANGIGFFRKISVAPENFPRHPPVRENDKPYVEAGFVVRVR